MSNIYKIPVLITDDYIKEYSPLPLNFDYDSIRPFIPIAESVWIVPIIGKALYQELLDEVQENNVSDVNATLLINIYQLEAEAIVFEALPFIWANLTEKGITIGKSDSSSSITIQDLNSLQNHLKSQITVLKERLKEFLEDNKECYPLYSSTVDCCNPKIDNDIRLYSSNIRKKPKNF